MRQSAMEDNTDSDKKVTSETTKKDWIDFWYNSEDVDLYRNHEEGC